MQHRWGILGSEGSYQNVYPEPRFWPWLQDSWWLQCRGCRYFLKEIRKCLQWKSMTFSLILLNHMALVISSLEGKNSGPTAMVLFVRSLRIFFFSRFSKIFTVILFFNNEDTCVSIRSCEVLCIIISTSKGTSCKLSKLSFQEFSVVFFIFKN